MTKPEHTSSQNKINSQKNDIKHKPSKKLAQQFQELFNEFSTSTQDSQRNKEVNSQKAQNVKSKSQLNETDTQLLKKFIAKDKAISDLLPEIGMDIIKQIEQIVMKVTQYVSDISATQNIQQSFHIQYQNLLKDIIVKIDVKNGKNHINITSDNDLHKLLSTYFTDLKKHLKKKRINFEDIELTELSSSEIKKELANNTTKNKSIKSMSRLENRVI